MIKNVFILIVILGIYPTVNAHASSCDNSCKEAAIEKYFEKLSIVFRKGSDESDVEDFFSLFHDSVKYQHFEYEAEFNKTEWMAAFKNNLKQGIYNKNSLAGMKVESYIFGKSHVAVEYGYGDLSEGDVWTPKGDQNLLVIFGFKENKIYLVREYW